MEFQTIERANKTEIYISTAREQEGLGTIDGRPDGYHAVCKVLARYLVGHSRPASVSLTLVFFPMWQVKSLESAIPDLLIEARHKPLTGLV